MTQSQRMLVVVLTGFALLALVPAPAYGLGRWLMAGTSAMMMAEETPPRLSDNTLPERTSVALVGSSCVSTLTWDSNDVSIAAADDADVAYTLPFTFPYFGRSIVAMNVNTNGLIELLETGESCAECTASGTHAAGNHVTKNIDAIFAANDNLKTAVVIQGFTDRVEILWVGTTYSDNDFQNSALAFKVILLSDGRVQWEFFDMNYFSYSDDLFSGLYDEVGNTEYEVTGGSTSFTGEGVDVAFEFDPNNPGISAIAWDSNDASIAAWDDANLVYTLPFTFPYFGRSIVKFNVNTNGLIELLESGESCVECDDYKTHYDGDHVTYNIDAIFAADDDLKSGVVIEGLSDRVEILWVGTTWADDSFESAELTYEVILFNDGRVKWKFFDMNYTSYGGDLFSGLYDEVGDVECEVPGGSTSFTGIGVNRAFLAQPTTTTWTGAVNTDWNTSGNWNNGVPDATASAVIPSTGSDPVVGAGGGVCFGVTIQSGATLTLSGGNLDCGDVTINGTLTVAGSETISVSGDWTNSGTFNAGTGTVTFDGGAQTANGTLTFNSLVIANDGNSGWADFKSSVQVGGNLTVNAGAAMDVEGNDLTVTGVLTNSGQMRQVKTVNGTSGVAFLASGGYGGVVLNAQGVDLGSTTVVIKGNQACNAGDELVHRCFAITPTNTTGRNATVTFYYTSGELNGSNCSAMNAYHWNGTAWETAGTVDTRFCTSEPYWLRVTGVSSFSSFGLKSGGSPTAITLTRFEGRSLAPAASDQGLAPMAAVGLLTGTALGVGWRSYRVRPRLRR